MAGYVMMTDSCCDLSAEMAAELELEVLPLRLELEGRSFQNYLDGREIGFRSSTTEFGPERSPSPLP